MSPKIVRRFWENDMHQYKDLKRIAMRADPFQRDALKRLLFRQFRTENRCALFLELL